MKKDLLIRLFVLILPFLITSCATKKNRGTHYQALARASVRLGIDIDRKDNHALYIEASQWIGTPYRSGGTTKNGVDCSGLTRELYRSVYRKELPCSTTEQRKKAQKVSRHKLKEGDLVFFSSTRSGKQVAHVGIYLKKNNFIHASTSKGVIVSNLNETYYRKHWLSGGKIN
ncbi:MAG: NlpC/P60 family protein [Bacteroides sp.]|nr:NlpC/P60 family protein [Bacteroides sp.]